ncbi:MAG: hypothetical protein HXX19_03335 [Rhodoferax sp.]|nr:hypothetical protein [Rhodoferax sp.]
MPKTIITKETLPLALHEIDQWNGKLTWELFAAKLASLLNEKKISRYTLMSYPPLVEAFKAKKDALKDAAITINGGNPDFTLEFAKDQIVTLEAKVTRLERQVDQFREQFVRWQHNLYMMPGVDMEKLNALIDKPMPAVKRK